MDALDEDLESFGRVTQRIEELLTATQNFLRVIITCRNQFLPLGNTEVFPRQDRICLGGFTCPVKYISPFTDEQVRQYLKKAYPKKWLDKILFREDERVSYAEEIVNVMGDLSFRPMLLSYVEDLVGEQIDNNIYEIYATLVEKWLHRESRKVEINKDKLLKACLILARTMTAKGTRIISEQEIADLMLDHPELSQLKRADLGGRSLLNKNSDGAFRFSHQSFQEFLVVHALEHGFKADWPEPYEMIFKFFKASIEKIKGNLAGASLSMCNLSI